MALHLRETHPCLASELRTGPFLIRNLSVFVSARQIIISIFFVVFMARWYGDVETVAACLKVFGLFVMSTRT